MMIICRNVSFSMSRSGVNDCPTISKENEIADKLHIECRLPGSLLNSPRKTQKIIHVGRKEPTDRRGLHNPAGNCASLINAAEISERMISHVFLFSSAIYDANSSYRPFTQMP